MFDTVPSPPPIARERRSCEPLRKEWAQEAIITVKKAIGYFFAGPPIIHVGIRGELHIDVPLMYQSYGLDRMHYDPKAKQPSPKGRPVHCFDVEKPSEDEIKEIMDGVISESRVVEAAEFKDPEGCWVVPLAWGPYIIAHVKVTRNGKELIPDYGLTAEVRRHVL